MVRNWADIPDRRIAGAQGSVADMEDMPTDYNRGEAARFGEGRTVEEVAN